ncbi:MAG: bifunctional enoyl-CoA hydratase/phosphate acetyltransferase [Calditrichaeota bacterium]|nr:bifunctional enoyl-CoA hydratase/phosphate acetyltransferase [Calditrichota bacterium]
MTEQVEQGSKTSWFDRLVERVQGERRKTIVVAMAQEAHVLQALETARKHRLAEGILVGEMDAIRREAEKAGVDLAHFEIVPQRGECEAVLRAIEVVRSGEGDLLMKGKCSTSTFLRGILDKEKGLRGPRLLSHLAIFEVETYPKPIFMSDAAMNISPDLSQKIEITRNAIEGAQKLGVEVPKVALIAAVEKVNPEHMPCTVDAAAIAKMADRGQLGQAIVDGPLAVDNALDQESCEVKGIKSPVGGDVDILIMPDIEAGNTFYKTMTILAKARAAGILMGARVPVVLPSRADSDQTKFLSIAAAVAMS